jgi:hypothetical protein
VFLPATGSAKSSHPILGASFVAHLLGYALDQVDWFEIADAWLEQAEQEA